MATVTPENAKQATPCTYIPWREEPVHNVLYEDDCITLYSAAAPPASPDANIVFHSHSLDTIFVMLCTASAVNEKPGHKNAHISLTRGGILVYPLTGKEAYVHRVRDHVSPLAFVGVEVALRRLPEQEGLLTVCPQVAEPLTCGAGFATASRVRIEPGLPFSLLRENGPGLLPMRTILVSTRNEPQLCCLQAFISPGASIRRVEDRRLGFYMAALLIRNAGGGTFASDAGCVLLNSGACTWEGIVIDVWGMNPSFHSKRK